MFLDYLTVKPRGNTPGTGWRSDDLAYFLPMAVFLGFTYLGGEFKSFFPLSYVLKTVITALLLIAFRGQYTKIRWSYSWLGALLGIVGVVQWVGMEKALLHFWPNYPRLSGQAFDPYVEIISPAMRSIFMTVRLAGPVLVVPFMEELFWRDYLWRSIVAPNDFKMAQVGQPDWQAFIVVTLFFASVHTQWMTAIIWGGMIGGLLMLTRSLGACIIMHAVTNLLLGIYVLKTGDWMFW